MAVIWIQMPGFNDNPTTANETAAKIPDPRVRHFYDPLPEHVAGKAFAKNRLADHRGPAWDIYFFYEKGTVWGDDPPEPAAWMHQLGGGQRADPARFHTGDDLLQRLHAATHLITGKACNKP